jgi:MoaA/NifB/PqqE/SkfB family radical SAM enzyme
MGYLRPKGIRRAPASVYDMDRGRLRVGEARRMLREWLAGERLTRHRGRWVLNSFLPPFPSRAYARMFDNTRSGRHLSPVSAFLAITAKCPMRCPHCSLSGRREAPELTGDEWSRTIEQLHGLGVSIIGFTGGEPCLRTDLVAMIEQVTRGGAEAILFTSGYGFTEELARGLRQAGLWSVCVSLDSDTAADHDAARGNGAFGVAVAALQLAVAQGFYTMIGTLATPESVDTGRIGRIHSLASRLGVHEMRIVEPMPCGRMTGCAPSELLSSEQIAWLRRFHADTNRSGRGAKVCAFNQIESPEVFGCGAGTQHLFIDPFGHVCPCDFTPLGFGNVRDTGLADIWERMSRAMGGRPRERCFIQTNHARIGPLAAQGLPLSPEASEAVCAEAGAEPLPGFFRAINWEERE